MDMPLRRGDDLSPWISWSRTSITHIFSISMSKSIGYSSIFTFTFTSIFTLINDLHPARGRV